MGQNCCNYVHEHFPSPRGGQLLFWRATARADLTLKLPTFSWGEEPPLFKPQAWWQQLHTLTCSANLRINWGPSRICLLTCSWCPGVKKVLSPPSIQGLHSACLWSQHAVFYKSEKHICAYVENGWIRGSFRPPQHSIKWSYKLWFLPELLVLKK